MTCNALTVFAFVKIGVPGKCQNKKKRSAGHGMHIRLIVPNINAVLNCRRVTGYDQRDDSAPVLRDSLWAIWRIIKNASLQRAHRKVPHSPVARGFAASPVE